MTTTYTPALRLIEPGVGDPGTNNAWGGLLNTDMALIEQAITGVVTVDLTGLTTYTLTATNGAIDQARAAGILFIGTFTSCTVTIPSQVRINGLCKNQGSGTVIMTTGAGGSPTTLTLQPNTGALAANALPWVPYYCDGTNTLSDMYPLRGSVLVNTAPSTTTFTVPSGVQVMKWTLEGTGGGGGSGSNTFASPVGGGGGGGGAGIIAVFGVTPGEVFTLALAAVSGLYFYAKLTCAAGDVSLVANSGAQGASGAGGGGGGAGGTAVTTGTTRTMISLQTFAGATGGIGWTTGSQASLGGQGGASGLGRAGGVGGVGAYNSTNPTPSVPYPGGGGGGGSGPQAGGYAGIAQIFGEW